MSNTITDIETQTRRYAEAREKLARIVLVMNTEMEAIKRARIPALRRAVAAATERHDELQAMIQASPDLFDRPRTRTLNGIRVGYMKGKGGIAWDDADAVIAAIQKHLPDQAEALIRWTGKPIKEAINQLDIAQLKKIGCRVIGTGDVVVIKAVDSDVDKLVDALLKGAEETAEEGAEA